MSCNLDARRVADCFQRIQLDLTFVICARPFWSDTAGRFLLEVDLDYGNFRGEVRASGGVASVDWDRRANLGMSFTNLTGPLFADGGTGLTGQLSLTRGLGAVQGDLPGGDIAVFSDEQTVESSSIPFTFEAIPEQDRADHGRLTLERRTDAAGPTLLYMLLRSELFWGQLRSAIQGSADSLTMESTLVRYMEINSTLRERIGLDARRWHWSINGNNFGWDRDRAQLWAPSP